MSLFACYFATNLLGEMGWPRKLGVFKGEGYDAEIADRAFAASIDWGAALGAGRPRLALQMISGMGPPDVKAFVEGVSEGWSAAAAPQEAVQPPQFSTGMSTISVKQFNDPQLRATLEVLLFEALVWGLSYPDRFEAWYSSMVADYQSMLPEAQRAGLDVGELPSLPQHLEDIEEIVRDYERDIHPLPSIPPRLLADAKGLGWRV
jgi:hypothetical protein